MKRAQILVADALHFSRRKFPPLYDFAAQKGLNISPVKSRAAWWGRTDAYRGLADHLSRHHLVLQELAPSELLTHRYRDIDVFACARGELMRFLTPRSISEPWPESVVEIASLALACPERRETVLLCMAAARDWIDFWHRRIDRRGPFVGAIAYGGRTIPSRTLLEVSARRGIRAFMTERFSTGRHYFFEEWKTAAERSLLADPEWYARLDLPCDLDARERVRAEAFRQLTPIRAAVAARPAVQDLSAPTAAPTRTGALIVLGQTISDPTLLEAPRWAPASPGLYRRLIIGLLDCGTQPVVLVVDAPPIVRFLREWRDTLPANRQARFYIAGSAALEILLPEAKLVVSLSAPLTLAACRAGLKPVQFEPTALAGKNFTHDFADPEDFLEALNAQMIDGGLTLEEYRFFEDFLVRLLLIRLVPAGAAGAAEIGARMADPAYVPKLREFGPSSPTLPSPWRTITGASANPTAALRLIKDRRLSGRG